MTFNLISIIASIALANSQIVYEVSGKKMSFYNEESLRIISSPKCTLSVKKDFCTNFPFLKDINNNGIDLKKPGGVSVGSEICKNKLKGKIQIALDKDKNQNSFCIINDSIYIDIGSIEYTANVNSGFKKDTRINVPD